MLNELLERYAEETTDFILTGISNGSEATKAEILAEVQRIISAEREAAMAAILETMVPETELIIRPAWDRVRRMRSNV